MRWLVTGAAGMLGRDLCEVLEGSVVAATRETLDITDATAVAHAVSHADLVINTAAWTDVDGAEAAEEAATLVNGDAVGLLAAACEAARVPLIQLSTDYVFDGTATAPYPESGRTAPANAYGRSKLAGETWSHALAEQLVALGEAAATGRAAPGVYHGTAGGETTWYGLARAVFAEAGLDPARVRPVTSAQFPRPAARPTYSVLGHERWSATGVPALPGWRRMLTAALPHLLALAPTAGR